MLSAAGCRYQKNMILWTIQTEDAWSELQARGVLRATRQHVEKYFLGAYEWMIEQMERRLAPRPRRNQYPLWAWRQWENEVRPKPDLRSGGHIPKGEKGVRIEFEIPDDLVLLSDFDLWHYVLNYWYLPQSESEGEKFEAELETHGLSLFNQKPLSHAEFHNRMVQSWNRIFDLHWSEDDLALPLSRKSIQATLWELKEGQVRNCKYFKSR